MHESNSGPKVGRLLNVGRFDRIAELMGIPLALFLDTYPDDVKNMKLSIMNYMKAVRTRQTHPKLPFSISKNTGHPKIDLQITPAGYPILPVPLPSGNWGKRDWENLFTMYMGKHYGRVPFMWPRPIHWICRIGHRGQDHTSIIQGNFHKTNIVH